MSVFSPIFVVREPKHSFIAHTHAAITPGATLEISCIVVYIRGNNTVEDTFVVCVSFVIHVVIDVVITCVQ